MTEGKSETSNQSVILSLNRKNVKEYVSSLEANDKMRTAVAENIEEAFKKLDSEIERGNSEIEPFALYAAKSQNVSFKHPNSSAILDSLSG
ncbi:MAG: hypothetical protein Q4D53_08320 [Leptotrichiaceae bacterium]|nr:hypothetical protein [Leptotrichiaceae bacterium]